MLGALAGGAIGAVNPFASYATGAAAGGAAASYAGQAAGNYLSGREVLNGNNYSNGAAFGAAFGSFVGAPAGHWLGRYFGPIRTSVIGAPVGANTVLRIPGNTAQSLVEGVAGGAGELAGGAADPCSCQN